VPKSFHSRDRSISAPSQVIVSLAAMRNFRIGNAGCGSGGCAACKLVHQSLLWAVKTYGAIKRAEALGHDAFVAELAGVLEEDVTVPTRAIAEQCGVAHEDDAPGTQTRHDGAGYSISSRAATVRRWLDSRKDGEDLRRTPIEQRKRKLAKLVHGPHAGIVVNEVFEGDGDILFAHACKLGCEGIVSKRLGSLYKSGRSPHWLKVKNPAAPAVKREAEEDWSR
jgi:hypothetical protein